MRLLTVLRTAMIVNVLAMLAQAEFAGEFLSGSEQALKMHLLGARFLVMWGVVLLTFTIALRTKRACPLWIVFSSAGILLAEIVEFTLGHFHNLAWHVPLGVAIFGGAVRQLIWVMREAAGRAEQQRAARAGAEIS